MTTKANASGAVGATNEKCPFKHSGGEPCNHPKVERFVCLQCGNGWVFPTPGKTAETVHLEQYHSPI